MALGAGDPYTGEGSGGADAPQRGTGAEPPWALRGQRPQKRNEFNILTLPKIAFPQRNFLTS